MRRADIVSAALEVFGEQGYDAATMDEIARRAEYTKRTLYAYFPSKLDLLLELIAQQLGALIGELEAALTDAVTGAEQLSVIAHVTLAWYRETPGLFDLMNLPSPLPPAAEERPGFAAARSCNDRLHRLIADAFIAGQADGTLRSGVDPELAALYATSMTSGLLQTLQRHGPLFETLFGVAPEAFIGFALQMMGASFLANTSGLGATPVKDR
jgi:TetR/AcrR family transcriptional regulator